MRSSQLQNGPLQNGQLQNGSATDGAAPASLDERRRRAAYRASHRGTKEMDWLLGRYAAAQLPTMTDTDLDLFEHLLTLPDPDLQAWLMLGHAPTEKVVVPFIERIRAFHKIDGAAGV